MSEVHALNITGATPLHSASLGGHVLICNLLLEHGANISSADCLGNIALHSAALSGNTDTVALLISHESDLHAQNDAGLTALEVAQNALHFECYLLMSEAVIKESVENGANGSIK